MKTIHNPCVIIYWLQCSIFILNTTLLVGFDWLRFKYFENILSGRFQGWRNHIDLLQRQFWHTQWYCRDQWAPFHIEIKLVAVRITLLLPTGRSYRTLCFIPMEGAPGKLPPSILTGIFGLVPNQILCLPPNSICYPLVFSVLCLSLFLQLSLLPDNYKCVCSQQPIPFFALYLFCY